jgi:hypothetical protein
VRWSGVTATVSALVACSGGSSGNDSGVAADAGEICFGREQCSTPDDPVEGSCSCGANGFCYLFQVEGPGCSRVCTHPSDCSSYGSGWRCAPASGNNADHSPGANFPYICRLNDGSPYGGCPPPPSTGCDPPYCCVGDTNGNQFCALPCSDSSTCHGGNCNVYDPSHGSCSVTMFCGP